MKELIILIFGTIIGISLSITVMIYGWGLEPKSWWWIIGGGIFLRILVGIMETAGSEKK